MHAVYCVEASCVLYFPVLFCYLLLYLLSVLHYCNPQSVISLNFLANINHFTKLHFLITIFNSRICQLILGD